MRGEGAAVCLLGFVRFPCVCADAAEEDAGDGCERAFAEAVADDAAGEGAYINELACLVDCERCLRDDLHQEKTYQ